MIIKMMMMMITLLLIKGEVANALLCSLSWQNHLRHVRLTSQEHEAETSGPHTRAHTLKVLLSVLVSALIGFIHANLCGGHS